MRKVEKINYAHKIIVITANFYKVDYNILLQCSLKKAKYHKFKYTRIRDHAIYFICLLLEERGVFNKDDIAELFKSKSRGSPYKSYIDVHNQIKFDKQFKEQTHLPLFKSIKNNLRKKDIKERLENIEKQYYEYERIRNFEIIINYKNGLTKQITIDNKTNKIKIFELLNDNKIEY